jgi:Txe/YoeB family toxin of Txe-Axe toxin-antitoxin module
MKDIYVNESLECYLNWQKTNKKHVKRINDLIIDIIGSAFYPIWKTPTIAT